MAGRHGNKGIVARSYVRKTCLSSGRNTGGCGIEPAGRTFRMNLGQIYETVLGWAGEKLGSEVRHFYLLTGANVEEIAEHIRKGRSSSFVIPSCMDGEDRRTF